LWPKNTKARHLRCFVDSSGFEKIRQLYSVIGEFESLILIEIGILPELYCSREHSSNITGFYYKGKK